MVSSGAPPRACAAVQGEPGTEGTGAEGFSFVAAAAVAAASADEEGGGAAAGDGGDDGQPAAAAASKLTYAQFAEWADNGREAGGWCPSLDALLIQTANAVVNNTADSPWNVPPRELLHLAMPALRTPATDQL